MNGALKHLYKQDLSALLHQAKQPLGAITASGQVLLWNKTLRQLLGIDAPLGQFLAALLQPLLTKDDHSRLVQLLSSAMKTNSLPQDNSNNSNNGNDSKDSKDSKDSAAPLATQSHSFLLLTPGGEKTQQITLLLSPVQGAPTVAWQIECIECTAATTAVTTSRTTPAISYAQSGRSHSWDQEHLPFRSTGKSKEGKNDTFLYKIPMLLVGNITNYEWQREMTAQLEGLGARVFTTDNYGTAREILQGAQQQNTAIPLLLTSEHSQLLNEKNLDPELWQTTKLLLLPFKKCGEQERGEQAWAESRLLEEISDLLASPSPSPSLTQSVSEHHASVLVVEDNPVSRMILRRALERHNYQVTVAATGIAAVIAAEQSQFDVLILDINLPDIDGLQVLKKIRQKTAHHFIPAIALTGDGDHITRERSREAGIDAFLEKPVVMTKLIAAITTLILPTAAKQFPTLMTYPAP